MRNWPAPRIEYVRQAADRVHALHRDSVSVVFVAHSQGAMIAHDLINQVVEDDNHGVNTGALCTEVLALASPITLNSFQQIWDPHLKALTANGDILDYTGVVDPNIPHFNSLRSDSLANAINGLTDPTLIAAEQLKYGYRIHNVVNNYFVDPAGSDSVKMRIRGLYDTCAP